MLKNLSLAFSVICLANTAMASEIVCTPSSVVKYPELKLENNGSDVFASIILKTSAAEVAKNLEWRNIEQLHGGFTFNLQNSYPIEKIDLDIVYDLSENYDHPGCGRGSCARCRSLLRLW